MFFTRFYAFLRILRAYSAMSIKQSVLDAIRARYGPQDASIQLSELLFFLESLKIGQERPQKPQDTPKAREAHTQRVNGVTTGRTTATVKQINPLSTTATRKALNTTTEEQPLLKPQLKNTEEPIVYKATTAPYRAEETQKRTYANITKENKGPTSQKATPKKATKPSYVPERLLAP